MDMEEEMRGGKVITHLVVVIVAGTHYDISSIENLVVFAID